MVCDYERAWIALKEVIVAKRSHGQKDLLLDMARIEIESRVDSDGIDPTPAQNGNGRRMSTVGSPREDG